MDKRTETRNAVKNIFQKFAIHKLIRLPLLNELIDEVNEYYQKRETPIDKIEIIKLEKFHEKHLKKQLDGWIKHLRAEKDKLKGDSDYHKGVKNGFAKVIEKLKDVATKG